MDEYSKISYLLDESRKENVRLEKEIYKLKGIQYKAGDIIYPKKLKCTKKIVTDFIYDEEEEEEEEEKVQKDEEEEEEENEDDEEEEQDDDEEYDEDDEFENMASNL